MTSHDVPEHALELRSTLSDDGIVTLELEVEKRSARVPLAKVSHGRLEVEFPKNG